MLNKITFSCTFAIWNLRLLVFLIQTIWVKAYFCFWSFWIYTVGSITRPGSGCLHADFAEEIPSNSNNSFFPKIIIKQNNLSSTVQRQHRASDHFGNSVFNLLNIPKGPAVQSRLLPQTLRLAVRREPDYAYIQILMRVEM